MVGNWSKIGQKLVKNRSLLSFDHFWPNFGPFSTETLAILNILNPSCCPHGLCLPPLDGERLRVDELQVALGEVESERDTLLEIKEKMSSTTVKLTEVEERETLLLKDIEDMKSKHSFAQAEFEQERDELNDAVTKSKLLLQVSTKNDPKMIQNLIFEL